MSRIDRRKKDHLPNKSENFGNLWKEIQIEENSISMQESESTV